MSKTVTLYPLITVSLKSEFLYKSPGGSQIVHLRVPYGLLMKNTSFDEQKAQIKKEIQAIEGNNNLQIEYSEKPITILQNSEDGTVNHPFDNKRITLEELNSMVTTVEVASYE